MHLQIDPKNYVAKLLHDGGMILGTLEFETYEILGVENSPSRIYYCSSCGIKMGYQDWYECSICHRCLKTEG